MTENGIIMGGAHGSKTYRILKSFMDSKHTEMYVMVPSKEAGESFLKRLPHFQLPVTGGLNKSNRAVIVIKEASGDEYGSLSKL